MCLGTRDQFTTSFSPSGSGGGSVEVVGRDLVPKNSVGLGVGVVFVTCRERDGTSRFSCGRVEGVGDF